MLESHLYAITTAIVIFPLLAGLFTVPYMIHQYRTYGSLMMLRVLIVYSFIFYLLCVYFLVILPLPSLAEVATWETATYNLIPFQSLAEFVSSGQFHPLDPSTYGALFEELPLLEPVCNIVMFVPLGVYLHYYFNCTWKQSVLTSVLLSLFFELTQLSGLYGIYPRPYRLFDVNDLMTNTFGSMLGFWVVPLLERWLPTRERLDALAFQRGQTVSYTRRFVALCLDGCITGALGAAVWLIVHPPYFAILYVLLILSYHCLFGWLLKATIGKRIVRIRVVDEQGGAVRWYSWLLRTILLQGMLNLIFVGAAIADLCQDGVWIVIGVFAQVGVWIFLLMSTLMRSHAADRRMFYERWTHTKEVSTIAVIQTNEDTAKEMKA